MPGTERRTRVYQRDIGKRLETAQKQKLEGEKYASHVVLNDVAFVVDEEKRRILQAIFPLADLEQAEQALRAEIIVPTMFLEPDGTEHRVDVFDPDPVGVEDRITYSLGLTSEGLFTVGRERMPHQAQRHGYWRWFLDRRVETIEGVAAWQWDWRLSDRETVDLVYEAMTSDPGMLGPGSGELP